MKQMIIILLSLWSGYCSAQKSFNISSFSTSDAFQKMSNNYDSEILGQWHNEGLDFILGSLGKERMSAKDPLFSRRIVELLQTFCDKKGIKIAATFDGNVKEWLSVDPKAICVDNANLSSNARSILCKLQANIDHFTGEKISRDKFAATANDLLTESTKLAGQEEQKICAITISTAKHSFEYWSGNFENYYAMFSEAGTKSIQAGARSDVFSINNNVPESREYYKIKWWAVALSDAIGAVNWGIGGAMTGGPLGALVCGFAGALFGSATSLVTQATYQQIKG